MAGWRTTDSILPIRRRSVSELPMTYEQSQLIAARARRDEMNQRISALQGERARLDAYIAELEKATQGGKARPDLPCWECTQPAARDVRHWLNVSYNEKVAMSLSGLPRGCCRIETFGRVSNPL
jgi:hypothetical protein